MIEYREIRTINRKKENGITILALVVTIIIILIIASISIWALRGENNIINQSMDARNQTISKDMEEEINEQWLLVQNDTKFEYPTNEELAQRFQDRLKKSDSSVQVSYNSSIDIFEITYKGKEIMFSKNGNIAIADGVIVTFDANGGSVSNPFKKVNVGQEYGDLPTPTRKGYTFLGWTYENLFNPQEFYEIGKTYGVDIDGDDIILSTISYQERYTKFFAEFKENIQYTLSYDWEIISRNDETQSLQKSLQTGLNFGYLDNWYYNFDIRGKERR